MIGQVEGLGTELQVDSFMEWEDALNGNVRLGFAERA
jgi:hypothetical protein